MPSKRNIWQLFACVGALLCACDQDVLTTNPTFPNGGLLRNSTPVKQEALDQLQGLFTTINGSDLIGSDAVVKTTPNVLSIFYEVEAGYVVLNTGCVAQEDGGARLVLEGYWRYALTSRSGLMRLEVQPAEVATQLCNGETLSSKDHLSLVGKYGDEDDVPSLPVGVSFKRNLTEYIGKFYVAGHHGACQNYTDCGASINSIETMQLMPALGADVAEVDVRISKDGVPFLYHDPSFTDSQSVGRYCHGKVREMSWAAIQANCRLTHGEQVPSLEDALRMAVDASALRGVWLDTKDPEVVDEEVALAKKYNEYAKSKGRNLTVVVGIPNEMALDAWKAVKDKEGVPCLLEWDPELVIPNGCRVWGPTWTAGPRASDVAKLQQQGIPTIFWTVNGEDYLNLFLEESLPNGFISDRPAQAFYYYQKYDRVPNGGFSQ